MIILQLEDQPTIIQAIFNGATDEVEHLAASADSLNCIDPEKRTPLHAAAFKGDAQIAATLLEHGALVNAKDSKWITPLHQACAVNADEVVELLLRYQADVSSRDRLWQTPLHIAAARDAYSCVDNLLGVVPNPNITDRSGRTALHHAAYNGNTFVAELLLTKGCIVNACDKKEFRPLHYAVQMGHIDTVELLLRYGADINVEDRNQGTPLHLAAANGMETIVKLLVSSGAQLNAQNSNGNTAMHLACLNGHRDCCLELAQAGADLEPVNNRGQVPLHIAAASAHGADCFNFLLLKEVDINRRSNDGKTPLHMTAIHGRFTRSKTLIDEGALIDCADSNGSTPLHIAAQYGHDILATTLLSFGANPKQKGPEGRTPLHMCCLSGYVECCRKFLQTGVDINDRDKNGRTPLHFASFKGSIECLDLLTSTGADFNLKDHFERLPLHYAAAQAHFQCVFTLVGIGSAVNEPDYAGCTPLHLAAAYDYDGKCVEYLLSHKAEPNLKDNQGFSPLHYAVACGNVAGVRCLLDVTEEGAFGKRAGLPDATPLHLAAKYGNAAVLQSILTKYRDVNIQSDHGLTPLMLVAREGHIQGVHFLLRFGSKVAVRDKFYQMTAVHYGAKNGHSQCLTLLLHNTEDAGVVNMVDGQQRTALMLAVSGNHADCVQALLKCGADPNIVDSDNHSALFRAVANGQNNIVQLLISHNAIVNTQDINGKTLLHLAASSGHFACLQSIVDKMSDDEISLRDNQDCSALHWACYNGHANCVEQLLSRNVFKKLEGNPYSAVHCASTSEKCLELLLNYFGNDIVRLKDSRGRTSLYMASLYGNSECARLLLNHGADANMADQEGRTPFIVAAQYGHSLVVELFLSCNIEKSVCDSTGNTALHWACLKRHRQAALAILERCEDVNFVNMSNSEGKTPLHLAARNGLADVTRELLARGASIAAVDDEGLTPALCCATNNNVARCLALIMQAMAQALIKDGRGDALSQPLPEPPKPQFQTIQTQTAVSLVYDPDSFTLQRIFRVKPPKIEPNNDCQIYERQSETKIEKIALEPLGKKLHKSCGDTSIHVAKDRRSKKFACRKCAKLQSQCADCHMRRLVKKHASGETTDAQLTDFINVVLNNPGTLRNRFFKCVDSELQEQSFEKEKIVSLFEDDIDFTNELQKEVDKGLVDMIRTSSSQTESKRLSQVTLECLYLHEELDSIEEDLVVLKKKKSKYDIPCVIS